MSDMTDAREEIEQRLNFLLPQAERMLNERGDFYPYAAALDRAGTIDAVAAPITGADRTSATSSSRCTRSCASRPLMARSARPVSRPT